MIPDSSDLWTNDFLDGKRKKGDPLADDLIDNVVAHHGPETSRNVFDRLIRNVELPIEELPEELHGFFNEPIRKPGWLDEHDLEKSWELFMDHGPKMLLLLYFKSLPLLYTDRKGARVLVRTGRLAHNKRSMEVFARRIAETGQFLIMVMTSNALQPGGKGITYIRKVRLIHSAIRHFIKQAGWDRDVLGEPVNQEDMALTLMTFSISLIDGLHQLGILEEDKKLEAYFQRWKAVGLMLGIEPDLIPTDMEQGRKLLEKILSRQSGPSEEGKILSKALIQFSKEAIPGKIFDVAPESLIRYFTGKTNADYLGIPGPAGFLGLTIPAIFRIFFNFIELLEERSPRIRFIADTLSIRLVKGMVGYFDNYKQTWFRVPEEFGSRWGIN